MRRSFISTAVFAAVVGIGFLILPGAVIIPPPGGGSQWIDAGGGSIEFLGTLATAGQIQTHAIVNSPDAGFVCFQLEDGGQTTCEDFANGFVESGQILCLTNPDGTNPAATCFSYPDAGTKSSFWLEGQPSAAFLFANGPHVEMLFGSSALPDSGLSTYSFSPFNLSGFSDPETMICNGDDFGGHCRSSVLYGGSYVIPCGDGGNAIYGKTGVTYCDGTTTSTGGGSGIPDAGIDEDLVVWLGTNKLTNTGGICFWQASNNRLVCPTISAGGGETLLLQGNRVNPDNGTDVAADTNVNRTVGNCFAARNNGVDKFRVPNVTGPAWSVGGYDFNSSKGINLANGTTSTDAAAFGQLHQFLSFGGQTGANIIGTATAGAFMRAPAAGNFVSLGYSIQVAGVDIGGHTFQLTLTDSTSGATCKTNALSCTTAAGDAAPIPVGSLTCAGGGPAFASGDSIGVQITNSTCATNDPVLFAWGVAGF